MPSFIEWDSFYTEAREVAEQVDGIAMTHDTGDTAIWSATCGCEITDSCRYPCTVYLCEKHGARFVRPTPVYDDKWEDAHLDQFQVGPSWFHQRRIETALTQLMTS